MAGSLEYLLPAIPDGNRNISFLELLNPPDCLLARDPAGFRAPFNLTGQAQPLVQVEAVKAPSGCFMMMSKEGLPGPSSVAWVIEIELPPLV